MTNQHDTVYEMVSRIPVGFVATYGQIARLINKPHGARQVGYALAALPDSKQVPWHRVVNAKGMLSARVKAGYEDFQRILLEDEGIVFNDGGVIDLTRFLWVIDIR